MKPRELETLIKQLSHFVINIDSADTLDIEESQRQANAILNHYKDKAAERQAKYDKATLSKYGVSTYEELNDSIDEYLRNSR